jgi:Tfp pilus assembly protein PilF
MAWLARAMVKRTQGDLAAAERDLDHVLRSNPVYAEAWIERGHVHLALGGKEAAARAVADYEKGLALDPTLEPAVRDSRERARAAARSGN